MWELAFSCSIAVMNRFWRPAAECLVASLALASLTVCCSRLHFNLATTSLLYVIVVVLIARVGSFVSSIVASIIAALCLALLAPPVYSFQVDDPLDFVAIAAFLVASLTIAGLVARVHKQAEAALSSVSCKVIEAEELERHRIADELHEDIGQRLALLVLEIERAKTATSNSMEMSSSMDAVLKQTLEIMTDVKTLAHELYSPRLEYLRIDAVMRSFCKDYGKRRGVQIDFRTEGVLSLVPPDVTLCLFRVLQEALHNAVKYSGTQRIDGRLSGTSDEIHLTVSDCGVGFNLETVKNAGGLGFNRMQERLKLVNGTLSIKSQPRLGTTIHARVPVSSECASIREVRVEAPESQAAAEKSP